MDFFVWCGLGLLGGLGAVLRFGLDAVVSDRLNGNFPSGTFAVNLAGALLLGLLVGIGVDGDALRLAGVGLLGSFTTFSTWMFESERLTEDGQLRVAGLNILASLGLGIGLAWLGMQVGAAL